MHRQAEDAGARHHLVDDERIELHFHGDRFLYRLRIWRSRNGPAIALASQVPGGAPPACLRSKLANLAFQAYLGYPAEGMLYFEEEPTPDGPQLVHVDFRRLGHGLRGRLIEPVERPVRWDDFRAIVGYDGADLTTATPLP
jgi:hypothetical protein